MHDRRRLNIAPDLYEKIKADRAKASVVQAFSKNFRTTRCVDNVDGDERKWYLFLNPEKECSQNFGLNRELLCLGVNYPKIDVRTFDLVETLLQKAATRCDQNTVFLITDASNAEGFVSEYVERTGRKVLLCTEAAMAGADDDFSFELLRRFLHSRDLFDVTDPVSIDGQFFARYKIVDDIFDTLSAGQNCGVYGLRKIGKTSVLDRLVQKNQLSERFRVARLDAQSPEIYANDAAGVAIEICRKFNRAWAEKHHRPFDEKKVVNSSLIDASRYFRDFIGRLSKQGKPLLVIIDELERILPNKTVASPWASEYLSLWRLLRSESQTSDGKFVFLLASTNPYFTEAAKFEGEDNPLYRFVRATYLPMFDLDQLNDMLQSLGKPMGVSFDADAIHEVFLEFGGAPFLSRQLCSHIANTLGARPLRVTKRNVEKAIESFRATAREDIAAILKVLADFYPEELELLRNFHMGDRKALRELELAPLATKHLLSYGLLEKTNRDYRFTMRAMPLYFAGPQLTEFVRPAVPEIALDRHRSLQTSVNKLEPFLRHLVMFKMKDTFGASWQAEVLKNAKDSTRDKIDSMGEISSEQLLEELYFPDLLHVILANWRLFSAMFVSKDQFKIHMSGAELAREMADHRKLQMCSDEVKFLKASTSCDWFIERLTR